MDEILKAGLGLKSVWYGHGENGYTIDGPADSPWLAKSIVVQMEYGQMAMVPWAKVTNRDDKIILINLAQADCIALLDDYAETEKNKEEFPF